jgi:hypothetical protein
MVLVCISLASQGHCGWYQKGDGSRCGGHFWTGRLIPGGFGTYAAFASIDIFVCRYVRSEGDGEVFSEGFGEVLQLGTSEQLRHGETCT